jgi:3',5'-cyclic AMP phosphodiesterase CpdA
MLKYPKSLFTCIVTIMLLSLSSCGIKSNKTSDGFSFVFMTDIHIQPELNAPQGFKQAMDSINAINPDLVITGGDLIMDALGQSYGRADSLYNLYEEMIKNLKMPVYNSMGNHEIYGIYKESGADKLNPEYGEKMFEKRLGESYYTFDHKSWKFMIINSIEDTKRSSYIGWIDSTQMVWISQVLAQTKKETPIIIITHIPFITVFEQKYYGSTLKNDSSLVVANSKNVIDLFKDHNLKLVLQGHLHTVEDIYIDGIHFITGGAICGAWWNGPNKGFEEGFMKIDISGEDISWEYKDYGWNVVK